MNTKVRIGVLVSGSGTNLQAIIDAVKSGYIQQSEIVVVISSKADAFALERGYRAGIESFFVDPKNYATADDYSRCLAECLTDRRVDLVCLAGFMRKIEKPFLDAFKGRIMNIHPALLPKFGGKGMYGHLVHEAVIKAGEKESGPTVHFVDEQYDHGPIILAF